MPQHIPQKTSIQLEPHQVIIKPLVTEKGVFHSTERNAYTFQVNKLATKEDIRQAIESLFDVKVVHVATQNRRGKPRRTRMRMGHTSSWKKAIVKLDDEHRIDFF